MTATQPSNPPYYIVGLSSEPLGASEAKMKFERLSVELSKAFPYVEEVRAAVKSKRAAGDHARYEVSVEIYTPKETHAFSETGYDPASVFDAMGPKMKRLLAPKQSRVTRAHGASRRKQNP